MKQDEYWVQSDYYFNHKDSCDSMAEMCGQKCVPVTLNGGVVVDKKDKYGFDEATSEQVENNIRERFSLNAPESGVSNEVGADY